MDRGATRVADSVSSIRVEHGDCRDVIRTLAEASIDAVVTDPPYSLVSIQKRFGKPGSAPAQEGRDGLYRRASAGFMGQQWDTGEVAFDAAFWADVLRVLKPGGHLVAFGGTRTYHRLACAIEDAGFDVRDQIGWLFGSGFPKSHDVAKGIDRALGRAGTFGEAKIAAHQRWIATGELRGGRGHEGWQRPWMDDAGAVANAGRRYVPATPEAAAFDGWGTALKPAWEPICLARKPLIGTVAANVLAHGTGALNIDACRIESGEGRWPANVVHDGSDEVVGQFPDNAGAFAPASGPSLRRANVSVARGRFNGLPSGDEPAFHNDTGSAARFFYTAKADADDRFGTRHPTVKPIDLLAWLVRMVVPPGGLVLDPFAGSGTTGVACLRERCAAILVEREAAFVADIRTRLSFHRGEAAHSAAVRQRHADAGKARGEGTPLFGGSAA